MNKNKSRKTCKIIGPGNDKDTFFKLWSADFKDLHQLKLLANLDVILTPLLGTVIKYV